MRIVSHERDTYEQVWALSEYGACAPGERYADVFFEMAGLVPPARVTVLDAGSGSGKGALALAARGCDVTMCDLTASGLVPDARALPFHDAVLWKPLAPQCGGDVLGWSCDYVYCCDVLEHIPTQFTMLAVARMLEVCRRGLFASIALTPDDFGVFVGRPLHQTVQSFVWWRDSLSELGAVRECRDLVAHGVYLVTP